MRLIKKLAMDEGITLKEAADRLGVHQLTVYGQLDQTLQSKVDYVRGVVEKLNGSVEVVITTRKGKKIKV
jgi:predicted DNA-binding protein (UPF0251 family)